MYEPIIPKLCWHIVLTPRFDSSFRYFHYDNDYYTEIARGCNGTGIIDIWDTDKPGITRELMDGTGPDNY